MAVLLAAHAGWGLPRLAAAEPARTLTIDFGQTRVSCAGNDATLAALASKSAGRYEVLLGSVAPAATRVTLELKGLPPDAKLQVRVLPATNLDVPLTAEHIPLATDYTTEPTQGGVRITLSRVEANQAYKLQFTR